MNTYRLCVIKCTFFVRKLLTYHNICDTISDVPNFAIILTDGNSNITPERTMHAAVAARVSGIHVLTVSVGEHINHLELQGMASFPTRHNMFNVNTYEDLSSLASVLPAAMCDGLLQCYDEINYILTVCYSVMMK